MLFEKLESCPRCNEDLGKGYDLQYCDKCEWGVFRKPCPECRKSGCEHTESCSQNALNIQIADLQSQLDAELRSIPVIAQQRDELAEQVRHLVQENGDLCVRLREVDELKEKLAAEREAHQKTREELKREQEIRLTFTVKCHQCGGTVIFKHHESTNEIEFFHSCWSKEQREIATELQRTRERAEKLLTACSAAKKYLEKDLMEPGRNIFWMLVDALAAKESSDGK